MNLSLLIGIANTSVLIFFSVYLYATSLKKYSPQLKLVNFRYAKDLLSLGLSFFILQIIALVYYETNNIIITKILKEYKKIHYYQYLLHLKILANLQILIELLK